MAKNAGFHVLTMVEFDVIFCRKRKDRLSELQFPGFRPFGILITIDKVFFLFFFIFYKNRGCMYVYD